MPRIAPALSSLLFALLLPGCHDWDRFVGEPSDGGLDGAPADGAPPLPCTPRRPPDRTAAPDGEPTEEHWYVLRDLVLDQEESWQRIGYDLDGLCSRAPQPVVECRPPNPSAALELDGEDGVDNAFGHWFLPAVASTNPRFEQEVWTQQAMGLGAMLVRLRGWNGTPNDPEVEVTLTQSVAASAALPDGGAPPLPDGGMPPLPVGDSSDWWWGREDTFNSGDLERPRALDDNAFVTDGVLVAHPPPRAPFIVSGREAAVVVELTDGVFTMELSEDGVTVPRATLAGRWPVEALRSAYSYIGACSNSELRAAVELLIGLASDLRERSDSASPSVNPTADCNAISVGLELSGYRARFAGLSSRLALEDLCADAGTTDGGTDMDGGT